MIKELTTNLIIYILSLKNTGRNYKKVSYTSNRELHERTYLSFP